MSLCAYDAYKSVRTRSLNTECAVESIAAAVCTQAGLWEEFSWPPVKTIERQVKLGRARADIVLHHEDGSLTIIEVKSPNMPLRDYATGVGQLAYQALLASLEFQAFNVRRVLATPWPHPFKVDLTFLCAAAGVDILPLPTEEQWQSFFVH